MKKQDVIQLSGDVLMKKLSTSLAGLCEDEAKKRLIQYGRNAFRKKSGIAFKIFANQFKSSIVYLLLVAALLSFFLHDASDGIIILVILFLNASLGFFQEYHSEKAVEKLSKLISKQALVVRGGKTEFVSQELLVPGDVVCVREGDIVPADIKLFETDDLSVNESQLTGESVSVIKNISGKEGDAAILFAGSIIERGEGKGIVYAIANGTELGKIAALSQLTKKITQYEKSLQDFSNVLIRITLISLLAIFVAKILLVHDISRIPTMLLFVVALAISVVPEALPVIATVTLSLGASRLAKKHVVVKRLSSVEDLGNINLLCTDKTGTLTENILRIIDIISDEKDFFQTLAYASTSAIGVKKKKVTDAFDTAFSGFVSPEIKKEAASYIHLKELPFDPSSRRRWVILKDTKLKKDYLVELGSAESLLEIAKTEKKKTILTELAHDGTEGIRHLAIAYKEIHYADDFDILKHEDGLLFLGYAKMADPLRPTAKETIKLAEALGVQIKILTGDSREVAQYVGREVGLLAEKDTVYTGDEFEKMSAEEKSAAVLSCHVFARVTPEQKYAIIGLLKNNYVVGYQGDGINDAPSLKLADVAIAVDNATDVAKDSADIVLLRKDLEVVINGIRYGRTIFVNINKYIKHTMVGNFGLFLSLAALYLFSVDLPILPIQVLLLNIIQDLPLLSVSSDHVDIEEVKQPEKYSIRSLMSLSLTLGLFTAIFYFMYFLIIGFHVSAETQTNLFLFLNITGMVVILSVRNKKHFWQGRKPSLPVIGSIVGFMLFSFLITYSSPIAHLFSFTALPAASVCMILIFCLVYILLLDYMKVYYFSFQQTVLQKLSVDKKCRQKDSH